MSAIQNLQPFLNLQLGGMSVELTMLTLAIVLGLFQVLIAARAGNSQRGLKWNVSARDDAPVQVGAVAGRLERASRNFLETFPFFAAAIVVAALVNRHSWATVLGSQLYLAARIVYLPLYGFGVPVLRTVVWLVSMIGLVLIIVALFRPGM
jgi:uncharacterized MAPEG superfamily protein